MSQAWHAVAMVVAKNKILAWKNDKYQMVCPGVTFSGSHSQASYSQPVAPMGDQLFHSPNDALWIGPTAEKSTAHKVLPARKTVNDALGTFAGWKCAGAELRHRT